MLGAGLAVTGVGLVLAARHRGPATTVAAGGARDLLREPRLAFFIQRPSLRRLVGIRAAADDQRWLERARRQRYVSYLMAGLVGTIGFLMSTKPVLW